MLESMGETTDPIQHAELANVSVPRYNTYYQEVSEDFATKGFCCQDGSPDRKITGPGYLCNMKQHPVPGLQSI